MNVRTRLCCLILTAPALALAAPTPVVAASPSHERCSTLTPTVFPHTADAIEGWFAGCYLDRARKLPPTADGAAGWLRR